MDLSQLKHLAICAAVLAQASCSTASKPAESVNVPSVQMASVIGDASSGERVPVTAESGLGMDSVVVGRIYIAASGRQCRQLHSVDGEPIQRVACMHSDGVWALARDLRPISSIESSGNSTSSGYATTSATSVMPHSDESADEFTQPLIPSAGTIIFENEEPLPTGDSTSLESVESVVLGAAQSLMHAGIDIEQVKAEQNTVQTESVLPDSSSPISDLQVSELPVSELPVRMLCR